VNMLSMLYHACIWFGYMNEIVKARSKREREKERERERWSVRSKGVQGGTFAHVASPPSLFPVFHYCCEWLLVLVLVPCFSTQVA
jgi:hypothetical protein